jgi:Set1/Ash2 histone methyltransferase complex subunit ASH2
MINTAPQIKSNDFQEQCYCLKPRDFNQIELQCCNCARWFHRTCIKVKTGSLVKFMINYTFTCSKCSSLPNGQESFIKKQASFHQMCLTTLANLTNEKIKRNSPGKHFFSKDKEIIPFIDKHWEELTNAPRRVKSTWHSTISRSMVFKTITYQKKNMKLIYLFLNLFKKDAR